MTAHTCDDTAYPAAAMPDECTCGGDTMTRTTKADLERLVAVLNNRLGRPQYGWTRIGTDNVCAVGALTLDGAYGGWALREIVNEGGAERERGPRLSKPAMADYLRGVLVGIELAESNLRPGRSYMAERATLQAEDMGAEAGRAAASWYEVSADNAASILRGIEDGDPAIMDTLPSAPLSGEWAGDPLPADILAEIDTSDLDPEEADELLTAYENAYSQAAQDELQRMARIHYTGPHVVGSITCDCDDMARHTPSITHPAP